MKTTGSEFAQISIALSAYYENDTLSCTNSKLAFDPPGKNKVVRVSSCDTRFIYGQFLEQLRGRNETPIELPDVESLRGIFDARQIEAFEERVQRKLFIPMTDAEVTAAKARWQNSNSGTPAPLPPKRTAFRFGVWALIIVAIACLQFIRNPFFRGRSVSAASDTMEYRGQQFKMRKAYSTFEDYKDDPDNLNTNELDRIEQTMEAARIPTSFKDRNAFIESVFDVEFPGYGVGGIGATVQTDDGSTLEIESVDIPQRDKMRLFVARKSAGQLVIVDDFVYPSFTNAIAQVKLERQKLRYYDQKGILVRETQL